MEQNANQVDAIAQLARKAIGDCVETVRIARAGADVPILIVDRDREVVDVKDLIVNFEKTQSEPFRRRGWYRAADVRSFLTWLDANTGADAPVFAEGAERLSDWKSPKLTLVGIGNYSQCDGALGWHDFGARLDFTVSEQWRVWSAGHEKPFSQADFAEFVESRIYDLSHPHPKETLSEAVTRFIENSGGDRGATPGKIVELSRGLRLTANSKLETQLNTSSGETTLNYSEEHVGSGGRPIKVPQLFYIRIPVFFGQGAALIGVRLRYRLAAGAITWSYSLFAPETVVSEQFASACLEVEEKRQLYLGSPDIP